jgi:hypothetical protein
MTATNPATYTVRLEYLVVAYASQEVTATSPEEAVALAREIDSAGGLTFDEDHESLGGETTVTVWNSDDTGAVPVLVVPSETEHMTAAAPHLVTALADIVGFAKSRAEDMHEAAELSNDPTEFARWRKADAAVSAAEQWLERMGRVRSSRNKQP